jgi:hypothetical protein
MFIKLIIEPESTWSPWARKATKSAKSNGKSKQYKVGISHTQQGVMTCDLTCNIPLWWKPEVTVTKYDWWDIICVHKLIYYGAFNCQWAGHEKPFCRQDLFGHHVIMLKMLKQVVQALSHTRKRKEKPAKCAAFHSLEITGFNFYLHSLYEFWTQDQSILSHFDHVPVLKARWVWVIPTLHRSKSRK